MTFRPVFIAMIAGAALLTPPSVLAQVRPDPKALALASPQLLERLRADPFAYFRFVNRAWTTRVCAAFADVRDLPPVRLHGDAHVEQFALTKDDWGLTDFDDSTRGPEFVDIVRFLGSIDLATRQRGWTSERAALWERFFDGYRRGLFRPDYRPPEPDIVRRLRAQAPMTRAAFLAWGENQMTPMDDVNSKYVLESMKVVEGVIRRDHPDLAPGYFRVVRAGWVRMGVGSAVTRKIVVRVQGPTADPEDDVLLEGKEVANLDGIDCLEASLKTRELRVVDGTRQLGRLRHDILAAGPSNKIPTDPAEQWLGWWVTNWEPSYREVHLSDLRSVRDLSAIVYDAGVQLGAGEAKDAEVRKAALSAFVRLKDRVVKETSTIVEELLAGWRELGGR